MTRRQAKRYACAWAAADLRSHSSAPLNDDPHARELIWEALNEIADELDRRGKEFSFSPYSGPYKGQ